MTTTGRYYELVGDMYAPGRWYLESPLDAEGNSTVPREFLREGPLSIDSEPVLPVYQPGHALDYTETEIGLIVASQRLIALFERLGLQDELQFIPAHVEGQSEPYFIVHTLRTIRCIDEARCEEIKFWEPRHGVPEKVGHYRDVGGLKIDTAAVQGADIFRPWGWKVALIVSERVKRAMEEEGITGARFIEV